MKPARSLVLALLAGAGLAAAGCAYRLQSPVAIDEPIRIQVVTDQGRYPRAGIYLQEEVSDQLAVQTGWKVRPDGSARLDLSLEADRISASGDDNRGMPTRWRIVLHGTALLVTRRGTRTHQFTGNGYASTREQEPAALRAAATDAATAIAAWLQQIDLGPKP